MNEPISSDEFNAPQQPAAPSGAAASAEPVAWVAADTLGSPHPRYISSLVYMSWQDRERGREYVPLYAAPQQPAVVDEAVDPALLSFYGVKDYPSLVAAMEAHVLKLIDTHKRNVKPWEDTFPQTLLPRFIREQGVVPTKEGLALAQKWEDEAAESWGEDPRHQAKQECCEELRALITAALAAQQQGCRDHG